MIHIKNTMYFFDLFVFYRQEAQWRCEEMILANGSYGLCDEEVEYLMDETFKNLRGGKQSSMYDHTFVIYMSEWQERSIDYGALQHEIFHTVHDVMRSRGVIFTEESEEAFAYLNGHLTTEIYESIFRGEKAGKEEVNKPVVQHNVT